MNRRYIGIGIGIVVVIVIVILFVLNAGENKEAVPQQVTLPEVTIEDEYEEGVHYIAGSITLPDRCSEASASGSLLESGIIRVEVSASNDEGLCLELPTVQEFSIEIEAPEEASIELYVNGTLVP